MAMRYAFYNKLNGKRLGKITKDSYASPSEINAIKGLYAYENSIKKSDVQVKIE
jgi:hypothetical protein